MKKEKEFMKDYLFEVGKIWGNDAKMMKYLENKVFKIIKLKDGLIEFEKPSVETRFCYGEDGGESLDIAIKNCEAVSTKFNVFLRENLSEIEKVLKKLKGKLGQCEDEFWYQNVCICDNYNKAPYIKYWTCMDQDRENLYTTQNLRRATKEEIEAIINVYEELKEYMIKKCKTYWKRFGGSKLHTWTYWVNA